MNRRDRGQYQLPMDPDLEVGQTAAGDARPLTRLRPADIGLVFIGGTAGTAAREGLRLTSASVDGVALVTVGINVVGAFLLGVLLESLAVRGPNRRHRRSLRLLLGTGFLGGFTTYSALATDAVQLLVAGHPLGVAYAVGTVLLGALGTWSGIAAAGALRRPQNAEPA